MLWAHMLTRHQFHVFKGQAVVSLHNVTELYQAVAEVLAYVYRLKNNRRRA